MLCAWCLRPSEAAASQTYFIQKVATSESQQSDNAKLNLQVKRRKPGSKFYFWHLFLSSPFLLFLDAEFLALYTCGSSSRCSWISEDGTDAKVGQRFSLYYLTPPKCGGRRTRPEYSRWPAPAMIRRLKEGRHLMEGDLPALRLPDLYQAHQGQLRLMSRDC